MQRNRLLIVLAFLPILSGCTGPDERESALIGYSGLPVLFVILWLFHLVHLALYNFRRKEKVRLASMPLLFPFIGIFLASIFIIMVSQWIFYPEGPSNYSPRFDRWFFQSWLIGAAAALVFLAPFGIILSNLLLKIFAAAGKIKYHYLIPLIVVAFYALVFVQPLLTNSLWPVTYAIFAVMFGLGIMEESSWLVYLVFYLGLLAIDIVKKKRPVA